jgi:hypothetical protein
MIYQKEKECGLMIVATKDEEKKLGSYVQAKI